MGNRVREIDGEHGIKNRTKDGKIDCSYCWTVKRDVFDIPMLIVMNVRPPSFPHHSQRHLTGTVPSLHLNSSVGLQKTAPDFFSLAWEYCMAWQGATVTIWHAWNSDWELGIRGTTPGRRSGICFYFSFIFFLMMLMVVMASANFATDVTKNLPLDLDF